MENGIVWIPREVMLVLLVLWYDSPSHNINSCDPSAWRALPSSSIFLSFYFYFYFCFKCSLQSSFISKVRFLLMQFSFCYALGNGGREIFQNVFLDLHRQAGYCFFCVYFCASRLQNLLVLRVFYWSLYESYRESYYLHIKLS